MDGIGQQRLAGALLTLAFLVFAVGATLPIVGPKGNVQVYTLPVREHLLAVGANARAWAWANVLLGTAVVLLVTGLTVLTTLLEAAGEQVLGRLGLLGFLSAAVLWLILSAFRASTTLVAAEEAGRTGAVPAYYPALSSLVGALFRTYIVVGCLALMAYGGSLLRTDVVGAWAAWTVLVLAAAILAHLLITGDTLPAFHYFPTLLIGILLLVAG